MWFATGLSLEQLPLTAWSTNVAGLTKHRWLLRWESSLWRMHESWVSWWLSVSKVSTRHLSMGILEQKVFSDQHWCLETQRLYHRQAQLTLTVLSGPLLLQLLVYSKLVSPGPCWPMRRPSGFHRGWQTSNCWCGRNGFHWATGQS